MHIMLQISAMTSKSSHGKNVFFGGSAAKVVKGIFEVCDETIKKKVSEANKTGLAMIAIEVKDSGMGFERSFKTWWQEVCKLQSDLDSFDMVAFMKTKQDLKTKLMGMSRNELITCR